MSSVDCVRVSAAVTYNSLPAAHENPALPRGGSLEALAAAYGITPHALVVAARRQFEEALDQHPDWPAHIAANTQRLVAKCDKWLARHSGTEASFGLSSVAPTF
jgi:hypothetical protein